MIWKVARERDGYGKKIETSGGNESRSAIVVKIVTLKNIFRVEEGVGEVGKREWRV